MTILGFDQSSTCSGWAVFQDNEYRISGVLKLQGEPTERLLDMADAICERIDFIKPDKVAIEDIFDNQNTHTLVVLARLQGIILSHCHKKGIPLTIIPSKTWRKVVGINEKKRKDAKAAAIKLVEKLYDVQVSADEAEAVLLTKASETLF